MQYSTLSKSFKGLLMFSSSKFPNNGRGRGPGGKFLGLGIWMKRKRRKMHIHTSIRKPSMLTDVQLLTALLSHINSDSITQALPLQTLNSSLREHAAWRLKINILIMTNPRQNLISCIYLSIYLSFDCILKYHNFNTMTEVRPLSKAPNTQLLPGHRSTGCPLLRVCVHGGCVFTTVCVRALGWVKCRAQIPSMGHHTWPHVTSLKTIPIYLSIYLSHHLSVY